MGSKSILVSSHGLDLCPRFSRRQRLRGLRAAAMCCFYVLVREQQHVCVTLAGRLIGCCCFEACWLHYGGKTLDRFYLKTKKHETAPRSSSAVHQVCRIPEIDLKRCYFVQKSQNLQLKLLACSPSEPEGCRSEIS